MNLIRSLLAAVAASVVFYYTISSELIGKVIYYGMFSDGMLFFYKVLHLITTTLLGTLCIFLSMFLLKERRKENISLIVIGVWAQALFFGSMFSGLIFFDFLLGAVLYVISVGIIAPNFTDYKRRIFSIANRSNQS